MQIELEIKFRLSEGAAARVWRTLPAVRARRRRVIRNTYFDTPDFRLRDARAALRLRRDGRHWRQSLKFENHGGSAMPERIEWEQVVPRGRLALERLPEKEIEARHGLRLAELAERLDAVFTTRFERRSGELPLPDGTRIEVSLDKGQISAGQRRSALFELELELIEGHAAAMLACAEQLIEPLGLQLEFRSKAQRGYRLATNSSDTPVKASSAAFGPQASVEHAFVQVFRASLAQVEANLRGTATLPDAEYLHQLRVGLRRMRTALRAFRGLVPRLVAEPLLGELRELMPALGSARDWDVLSEILKNVAQAPVAGAPALAPLLRRVALQRARARRAARACVISAAFQRFILHGTAWMERKPWRSEPNGAARPVPDQPVATFANRALTKLEHRAARSARRIDWRDPVARHGLRVRLKRLRYACEFFASCSPRKAARRYLERLEGLQDLLGELNDLAVARRLLAPIGADECAPAVGFVQGWLAAREQALMTVLAGAWRALRKTRCFW